LIPEILPSLCPRCRIAGEVHWAGSFGLRHPYDAADEINVDLSTNQEPTGGATDLGHTKLESRVRYLGIEVDDAIEIAEQTEL
jgi:hypothetical protein